MNHQPGDIRIGANAPGRVHRAFSRMRWLAVPSGENRKERRAIGAKFRAAYGKAEFAKMKARISAGDGLKALREMIERINEQ